ncbi:CvpA family protein [Aneurinibacillus tyrosinisolvens]|uniref:CvpA family protein n=1 Tax=Aneurinibacillus tyrosinisolvens TaxID=1443435 RepID=UPI00063FAAA9|nr:CvpA family protein [Aneurinibacillus tyrosinisolvens]
MMNILDGILIVILLLSIWSGYRQGLVLQLVKLAGLVLSFAVAFFYYKQLAVKLMEWFPLSKLQSAGSFSAIGELPFVQHGLYNVIAFFILASLTG